MQDYGPCAEMSSQKLKMELCLNPAIPLPEIYLKNPKTPIGKELMHAYVHRSTIHNSQALETAQCP